MLYFSSVLNVLFARAFAQHLNKPTAIIPSSVNPGLCSTELGRNLSTFEKIRLNILRVLLARSAEQGSRQLVWAALGPDGKDGPHVRYAMSGAYVSATEVHEPSDFVISKEGYDAQEKIWVSPFLALKCASDSLYILFFSMRRLRSCQKLLLPFALSSTST